MAVLNSPIILYRYDFTRKSDDPRSNLRHYEATFIREVHDLRGKNGTNPIIFLVMGWDALIYRM